MPYLRNLTSLLLNVVLTLFLASSCFADYGFNLSQDGTGSGKIVGPDFQCFSRGTNYCAASFPAGSTVTLTASAAPGSVFSGWTGACSGAGEHCTVLMDTYKTATAIFSSGAALPDLDAGVVSETPWVSINSLGEVAWTGMDPYTEKVQIFSSMRAPLSNDTWSHDLPAVNSLGDAVWVAYGPGTPWFSIQGVIGGAKVKLHATGATIDKVDINDRREVVWSQNDGDGSHIYSSVRGQLTSGSRNSFNPGINNNGDLVYLENDPVLQDPPQVYKLSAGSTTPVAITADALRHFDAAINDAGEVVWSELDEASSESRVVSSQRGVLRTYPQIMGVDINNCGDVAYGAFTSSGSKVFRLGSNSPCAGVTGTHDTMEQAAPVALGDIFTALADGQAAPVAWYRFEASAGDDLNITVNYDARFPNLLVGELYDPQGVPIAYRTFDAADPTMVVLGRYTKTGSYLLKLEAQAGQFPYSVSLSRSRNNCGAGPCPDELYSGDFQDEVAINSLGVVAWSAYESFQGYYQILTSLGDGLVGNRNHNSSPAITDLSEGAWLVSDPSLPEYRIEALIDSKLVVVATGAGEKAKPGINNKREIVWSERDGSGIWQIHSSLRGQLTSGLHDSSDASIDNSGNVAYIDNDRLGHLTVMKIPAGTATPVAVKEGLSAAWSLSIADSGELTWVQPSTNTGGPSIWQIESSSRGTLLHSLFQVRSAAVNSCGDLAYITDNASGTRTMYRFGNNSPCLSFPGSHATMEQAVPVAVGGDMFTGLADSAAAPVSWYRFDAGAGDTIRVSASYDTMEPNYLTFTLYDASGRAMWPTQGMYFPPVRNYFTVPAAGPYFLKVEAEMGRTGYGIKIDKFVPAPFNGFPVQVVEVDPRASINSLGEVVWVAMDYVTGWPQIYSSLRGQLTFDAKYHFNAAINDVGDLVWVESDPYSNTRVQAVIAGKSITIADLNFWSAPRIALSNAGEVVWSENVNGVGQVFSSTRGQLTSGAAISYQDPDINNRGDIVFTGYGQGTHIYKIAAGSATAQRINPGAVESQMSPAINDNGEIIWRQDGKLFSNVRGELNLNGGSAYMADINNCGDIVYDGNAADGAYMLYRIGYSSPCLTNPGSHETREQAAPLGDGEVSVGLADPAAPVSWYRLEGNAGDTIQVRVHYDNTAPNTVTLGIYDADGNLVAGPTGAIDRELDYSVPAGGVYFLKVEGEGGRFGYAVSAKRSGAPLFKLMVEGLPDAFFSTLADVFALQPEAGEMKLFCRSGAFAEDLAVSQCGKVIRFSGGYDTGFSARAGKTRINGKLKLTCGNLVVDGMAL